MIGPICVPVGSSIAINAAIVAGAAGGAAFGASNTLLHGGSFSQALDNGLKGAFAGAITGGIAGQYGNTWNAQRIGASAFSGGISAELQGGKFKDGFKAAFIGSSLRYLIIKLPSLMWMRGMEKGQLHLRTMLVIHFKTPIILVFLIELQVLVKLGDLFLIF
ncbi:hypothetical protein BSPWISOXPB_5096 [uncultured Gammaproteobacteria bacterium]|nr:hypothetical protein BSPWISOXPB_5096 [uncultured Gammaproteobacteria bacterium]